MSGDYLTDVSHRLGEYMLKGWVLTDHSCTNSGCSVPLMRSPTREMPVTHFCVNCDSRDTNTKDPINLNNATSLPALKLPESSPSIFSSSHVSPSSTPPTEVSPTLSSPTFAPPVDTEESRRRREQSDTASAEIGKRLLKGWAMLAEECPSATCYWVPLVRPPKAVGGKDPRKECVICRNVYISDTDAAGWEQFVPADISKQNTTALNVIPNGTHVPQDQGKITSRDDAPQPYIRSSKSALLADTSFTSETSKMIHTSSPESIYPQPANHKAKTVPTLSALDVSARSLESALYNLSERLPSLSGGQTTVDSYSIGLVAEAIGKVALALSHVKQLQRSESQALAL